MKFYGIELEGYLKDSIVDIASGPRALTTDESGRIFTNTGSSGSITFTLPTAAKGLIYSFAKVVAQDIVIDAADGDYIADSTASGNISNVVDAETWGFITLLAVSASMWLVYGNGTWKTA
jgi:hypothetical protein